MDYRVIIRIMAKTPCEEKELLDVKNTLFEEQNDEDDILKFKSEFEEMFGYINYEDDYKVQFHYGNQLAWLVFTSFSSPINAVEWLHKRYPFLQWDFAFCDSMRKEGNHFFNRDDSTLFEAVNDDWLREVIC